MKRDAGHAIPTFTVEARVLSFKKLLAAGCLTAAAWAPQAAHATTFLTFSQSGNDIVTTTDNGSATTIHVGDGAVSIGTIDGSAVNPAITGYLDLTANSQGAAITLGGYVYQAFSGTFSVTSGTGDTGTNYLSGSFTSAAGSGKGNAFGLIASQPPADEITNVTSDEISNAELAEELALSLSFTNLTSPVAIDGTTLGGFTANISGTFSGTYPTPEPASVALLFVGLTGIGFLRLRRS